MKEEGKGDSDGGREGGERKAMVKGFTRPTKAKFEAERMHPSQLLTSEPSGASKKSHQGQKAKISSIDLTRWEKTGIEVSNLAQNFFSTATAGK